MTLEVELNERTMARLKQIAKGRHLTVEMVLKEIVERFLEAEASEDAVLGMFAQEPELMDAVVREAMDARESDRLRQPNG
jgi:predicted transcriptional regulator